MAATYTELADGSSISSTASVTTASTITATVVDKDWLIVFIGAANAGVSGVSSISSVTDSAGNTYTQRVNSTYTPGATASDGATLGIFTAPVTTAITNGTITVNFSPNTPQKAVTVVRARPGSGETMSFVGGGSGSGGNGTAFSTGNVSVTSGDTIFGAMSLESDDLATGDSDTVNGSWSAGIFATALGAGDTSSMQVLTQYKTVNATGNQNATLTIPSAQDGQPGHIILRSSVAAYSLVAAAGSYTITGTDANLKHGWKVAAGASSYALSGTNATFRLGLILAMGAGSYALTGTAATLTHPFKLAAGAGSYALSGTNASPKYGKKVQALVGAYTMGGTNATLTKSGVAAGKTIAAGAGLYTLTGNQNLVLIRAFTSPGSYLLTGTAASPLINSTASSSDGRPIVSRTGEGYSEEDAKEARRNKWEAEQFRLKLEAMYDGREYVEQPFPEDITPAQRAAAAALAAAERAVMFQGMLTEQQARQRMNQIAQQFAMRQAQDEEDAATIAVMGD